MPIAEAAAKSGFDCSEWTKMRDLINAVKGAAIQRKNNFRPGPRYRSSIYPDRWRPDTIRPHPGVVEAYRDTNDHPAVPAFGKSAAQIIKDLVTQRTPVNMSATSLHENTNQNIPRQTTTKCYNTGDKRTSLHPQSAPKRLKTEQPRLNVLARLPPQTDIVDLTQDIRTLLPTANLAQPVIITTHDPALQPTNGVGGTQRPHQSLPKKVIRADTISIFSRCASKLRAAVHGIDTDRESLRERWVSGL